MSTFQLPEAVHVSQGNDEFDFAAGSVTAQSFREEQLLDGLVATGHADLKDRSDPPAPVADETPAEPTAPADPVVPVAAEDDLPRPVDPAPEA